MGVVKMMEYNHNEKLVLLKSIRDAGEFVKDDFTVDRIVEILQPFFDILHRHNFRERYIFVGAGVKSEEKRDFAFEKEYSDSIELINQLNKDFHNTWVTLNKKKFDTAYFSIIEIVLSNKVDIMMLVYENGEFKLHTRQSILADYINELASVGQ